MKRNDKIHIIWQDPIYENEADYMDAYREYLDINDITEDDCSIEQFIEDENNAWYEAEFENLNVEIPNGIFALGLLGLWNGTHHGTYEAGDRLNAFLTLGGNGYFKHYCKGNELVTEFSHHDGTNTYRWYEWRDGVTQAQQDALLMAWWDGCEAKTQKLLNLYAKPLGSRVNEVYGR